MGGVRQSRIAAALAFTLAAFASPARAAESEQDTWSFLRVFRVASPHIIGMRAHAIESRGGGDSKALSLAGWGALYYDNPISIRSVGGGHLGSGDGLDAGFSEDISLGRRFDFERYPEKGGEVFGHGIFARGGARGFIHANDTLLLSALELPTLEVGYQLTRDASARRILSGKSGDFELPLLVEAAFRGGVTLGGALKLGDYGRTVRPAPEVGGHLALTLGPVHFGADASRTAPSGPIRTFVDVVDVSLCAHAGEVAVCGDGKQYSTGMLGPNDDYRRELVRVFGFTVGFGS